MTAGRVAAGMVASGLTLLGWTWRPGPADQPATSPAFVVPCEEDQLARVAHDPDPSHGLTWECVHLDELRP